MSSDRRISIGIAVFFSSYSIVEYYRERERHQLIMHSSNKSRLSFSVNNQERKSTSMDGFRNKSAKTTFIAKSLELGTKKLEREPSVDINESAEAFINKFKRELMIQRLESIENYEQMLARGL